jgi:hypothetical protein
MLTLDDCRKILGDHAPADERTLEDQRAHAYRLASLLLELYRAGKSNKMPETPPEDTVK